MYNSRCASLNRLSIRCNQVACCKISANTFYVSAVRECLVAGRKLLQLLAIEFLPSTSMPYSVTQANYDLSNK